MSFSLTLHRVPDPPLTTSTRSIQTADRNSSSSTQSTGVAMRFHPALAIAALLSALIVVGLCLEKIDFLLVNEVKTLVSVIFGFATSCFLLSVIWVIQEKKVSSLTWPMSSSRLMNSLVIVNAADQHQNQNQSHQHSPNDAQVQPGESGSGVHDRGRRATVCTIISLLDHPPNYEDALVNSKPISYTYLPSPAASSDNEKPSFDGKLKSAVISTNVNVLQPTTKLDLFMCQLPATDNQQQQQHDLSCPSATNQNDTTRKPSFCQLNAYHLMLLSSSPPKYADLYQNLNSYFIEAATGTTHTNQADQHVPPLPLPP